MTIAQLYDLSESMAGQYLSQCTYPWEALSGIKEEVTRLGEVLDKTEFNEISPQVWVHKTVKIAPTASIGAPCIIGANTEIRQCAFIRGSAIIGEGCVIGNSVEIKNAIIFDGAQVPHFNYVGDSILGVYAHMGAGSITSNVKSDKKLIVIHAKDGDIPTGLKKTGAFLGDHVEVGCNSVLNPGTVIGRGARVYPLSCVRGVVPADSIYKHQGEVALIEKD